MRRLVVMLGCLALVGCEKSATQANADQAAKAAPASASPATPATSSEKRGPNSTAMGVGAGAQPALAMLAYIYDVTLVAPAEKIEPLVARHEAACAAAGAALCEVTGSTLEARGKDNVHATLAIRAAPDWLTRFRSTLAADAKASGGRLARATTASEDLSRQIVDTQAAVRAKTALRDRLQTILETRQGKMSDLVDLETSIAQLQGELDATQSELAMMRERVATSAMTIEYQSSGVLAPEGTLAPLGKAVDAFSGHFVAALAVMIQIISWLAPWALVGGLAWIMRGRVDRMLGRLPRPSPPPAS